MDNWLAVDIYPEYRMATSDPIKLALVQYHEGWTPGDNLYHRFLRKRKSFEHERELRGIPQLDREEEDAYDRKQITENGKYVTVDVDTLISNIYVAPKAQAWVVDLVKDLVAARYGLQREQVIKSDLYSLDLREWIYIPLQDSCRF